MAKNDMLRSALFGGYNKSDVDEYIQTLENEIEAVKALHQKEKNDLLKKLETDTENRQEQEQGLEIVKAQVEQERAELEKEKIQLEKREREFRQREEQFEEEKKAAEKNLEDAKFQQSQNQEEIENSEPLKEFEEAKRREDDLNRENERLTVENDILRAKLKKANMKWEDAEDRLGKLQAQKEKELFDYETLAKILEDANKSAEGIKEDAREEGQRIIEEAMMEAEKKKEEIVKLIDSELEKKNIQMVAVKYRIAEYMKEVYNTQQGLYNLYDRMNHIVDNIPLRLEDYWSGEDYRNMDENDESVK